MSYLVLAVAVIAFAAISRSIPAFFTSRSMELVAAVLGAASTVFMVLSFTVFDSVSIQYLTTILCACVLGWLYLQWGTFYAQLGLRSTVCYLFLANIGGSTIKAFSHFIPTWGQCLLGMALPVLSVVMCKIAIENARKGASPTMRFESHNMRGLWKVAVAIAAFSFVVAFLVGQFLGNQNSIPVADFLMSRLFEIAISAIVLFITVGLNKPFNFSQLWRIALLVLALDLLTQAAFPEDHHFALRGKQCLGLDRPVRLADAFRHCPPFEAVGALGFRHWLGATAPFAIGSIAASAYPAGAIDAPVIVALMFVLVLLSTFCLELRDQDTKWLFAELRGEPVSEPSDFRSIDERCEEVCKQHGLTPRASYHAAAVQGTDESVHCRDAVTDREHGEGAHEAYLLEA